MNERPTSEQQSVRDTTDDTLNRNDDVMIGDDRTQSNLQQQTRRETTSGDIDGASDRDDTREVATAGNRTATTSATTDTSDSAGFLPDDRMDNFRQRWNDVQAAFVDDPRSAVQRAQQLVDDLVQDLTNVFSNERSRLEGQWSSGGQADTEALRIALQRYRDFFNRLLGT